MKSAKGELMVLIAAFTVCSVIGLVVSFVMLQFIFYVTISVRGWW
jgi:hypothetical protein